MSRRKVDYVYVPKKKIKKVVIDAKRGRKSIEKTVNQRQILDGAYVRASAMKEFPNGKFAQGGTTKPYRANNFRKIEKIDYVGKDPNLKEEKWEVYVVDPKGGYAQFNVYAENQERAEVYGKYLYSKKYNVPQQELMIEVAMPYSWTKRFQIKNQYAGKTAEEIWTAMDFQQRRHFMRDHKSICGITDDEQMWDISWFSWEELKNSPIQHNVVQAFEEHIKEGQYKRGGNIGSYNEGRSWTLDHNQHNKRESYEIPMDDRKFANGGMTKNYISVGDIVLDKNDNKYYIVYEVKNDAVTKRYFLPDEVAESVAAHINPELIDWNKYTMYSDESFVQFSVGDLVYNSAARKSGVIIGKEIALDGEYVYSVKYANNAVGHFINDYELELISTYKRGGNIGSYNTGRSWTLDHNQHNKRESYEIPMDKRKFMKGGSVGNEFEETFVVDVYSELGDDSYTIEATDGKQAFEEARYLFKKENPQYKGQIDLSMRDKYAKGGKIKNQYAGKTAREVWGMWTNEQRKHFLGDHYLVGEYEPESIAAISKMTYDELRSNMATISGGALYTLENHIMRGQYKRGGNIGSYNTGRSWTLDHNQHNKSENYEIPMNDRKYAKGGKVGEEITVEFKYKNNNHKFSFTPEESDWWTSFKSKDLVFDLHYDEDYGTISVYEYSHKGTDYTNTVYSKKIMAKGGEIPDLTNMNIDHLFANGGRTYSTAEEKIYS